MAPRAVAFALLLTVEIGFAAFLLAGGRPTPGSPSADFAVYYVSAQGFAAGEDPYAYEAADWQQRADRAGITAIAPPYRYAPLTAIAIIPLATLPFPSAVAIWMALTIGALATAACTLSRALTGRWLDTASVLAVATSVPALNTLYTGQVNAFVLLGVAAYLLYARSGRRVLGAAVLAVSVVAKPLAATVALLESARGGARGVLGLAVGLLSITIPLLALGMPAYLSAAWRLSTLPPLTTLVSDPANQSIAGSAARLTSSDLAAPAALVAALALGAVTVALLWDRLDERRLPLEVSLVITATALMAPVTWYHHLVLGSCAVAVGWHSSRVAGRAVVVAAVLATAVHGVMWRELAGHSLLQSLPTYGLLALYAVLGSALLGARRGSQWLDGPTER